MRRLMLASRSPRRSALLRQEGYEFEVAPIEISEKLNKNLSLRDAISDLAKQKAQAWLNHYKQLISQDILCISADTMVIFEQSELGKPKDLEEAQCFLRLLSGKTHSVITGFCLLELPEQRWTLGYEETFVEFYPLCDESIQSYLEAEDVLDKAGGYAIQGKAQKFVRRVSGSFSNVVGLPMERIIKELDARGIRRNTHST